MVGQQVSLRDQGVSLGGMGAEQQEKECVSEHRKERGEFLLLGFPWLLALPAVTLEQGRALS